MRTEDTVPDGYWLVDAMEVWTNGAEILILGNPHNEEQCPDDNVSHNCDQYSCGSVTPHILYRGPLRGSLSAEWLPAYNLEYDWVTHMQEYVKDKTKNGELPTIRELSKRYNKTQSVILKTVEDLSLNVNIAFGTGSGGFAAIDDRGDWTVEDLEQ